MNSTEISSLKGRLLLLSTNLTRNEEGWPNLACHLVERILMVLKACLSGVVDEVLHGRG
jgi:hypothetical protein